MAEKSKSNFDISSFWGGAANVIVIAGILLYFIGWIYLYYFFSFFKLSTYNINVELKSYYFYAFFVLIKHWYSPLLILLPVIIYVLLFYIHKYYFQFFNVVFLVILTFTIGYFLANRAAFEETEKTILKEREITDNKNNNLD